MDIENTAGGIRLLTRLLRRFHHYWKWHSTLRMLNIEQFCWSNEIVDTYLQYYAVECPTTIQEDHWLSRSVVGLMRIAAHPRNLCPLRRWAFRVIVGATRSCCGF